MSKLTKKCAQQIEKTLKLHVALASINTKRGTNFTEHKPKQCDVLLKLFTGDVVGVLPTGYGKSLIFESIPFVFPHSVVIIASPLTSIISEQVKRYGNSALEVAVDTKTDVIRKCHHTYYIGHPEYLTQKKIMTTLLSPEWQSKQVFIVVDEAHCVIQWGPDFRPAFSKLVSLRATFPHGHWLALTATATLKLVKDLTMALRMNPYSLIALSPDRPNICLNVKLRPPLTGKFHGVQHSYDAVFQPIFEELREKQSDFPKTIIYTKVDWCGRGHEEALKPVPGVVAPDISHLIAQYHSPCTPEMRADAAKGMGPEGQIRLLLATEAYSMGTDCPDIRRIIHIGVPKCLEVYIQEIGRAGRDGRSAEATMFYNKSDIARNIPGMADEMKEFCELKSCRRRFLCEHFGTSVPEAVLDKHQCCDNCAIMCDCITCLLPPDESVFEESLPETPGVDMLNLVTDVLQQYFDAENSTVRGVPEPCIFTGLDTELAKELGQKQHLIDCMESLQKTFPQINKKYTANILSIILKLKQ